ncbi:hypothetical protein BDQ17DRAFT_1099560 [Cyathus striatus]|nr:hypothetical protein BDQ17DRAFT_1099560 [Cyathus striatus]
MLTLDESGKTLIFSPSEEASGGLVNTLPRVTRTTEKQDFARLLGGKLWTAARGESSSHGGHKIPIKRVFDPFNPASTGRSLIPTEHVGAVTPGTILSSHPGHVYLGHEEGFILICSLEESDYPRYIKVVKVSLSDVLCLEGVNDRLWAGGRNGMIAAYDMQCKRWVVRNCRTAHPGLPVVRLVVDYLGVQKGRLCVVSVGRDEAVRFWDGLLGLDWIDKELLKAENEYSTFRDVTAPTISRNRDSTRPDALTSSSDPSTQTFLSDALNSVESPDIIAFGFQEVIDLESRKMTAKNVLLGSKKKEDMGLSEKVEIVFFHGDMNYRIEARRDAIIAAVRAGDYASLIPHDQLVRELKYNRAFRLRGFSEDPLTFAPTYKYDPRSNEYDTSEKHRSPAWCDRFGGRGFRDGCDRCIIGGTKRMCRIIDLSLLLLGLR